MKFSYDATLEHQTEAINAVVGLFEGQPLAGDEFSLASSNAADIVSNQLRISDEQILTNLQTVQEVSDLEPSSRLDGMHFSVEMETGTGKTYVYLRTVYELNKMYGFKKFVIVVPSVAIREGVLKQLQTTHSHFQTLYDKPLINFEVYDSTKTSMLRGFASNNFIEILVINIDSFAKDENVINKPSDKLNGEKPIAFIQAVNPIVIVDEPQNMETVKRSAAIENLHGLCTLRYSATHLKQYNLVCRLSPVKAYDLGLVKQIEVDSVMSENAFNDAFIEVASISATKTKVTAKLVIDFNDKDGVKKKPLSVKVGDDLYKLSNEREVYASGYIVEEIDAANQCISLSNGNLLYQGDRQGGLGDEVMKFQIRKTIEEHLKKEMRLNRLGIKVLSLFFIDKVANYRSYDADGQVIEGKFAQWFKEIYQEYIQKPAFKELDRFALSDTHNGYFSQDKNGNFKDTNGSTKADDDTYSLIMKDKERLLDIDTPLRFIFSHSALREGWDNPNVFQICTLNETKSETKKRQEIGRGLRLAVNQSGERIYDKQVNRLTVIANESYEDFASSLQKEIESDCGVEFKDRIKNKQQRTPVKYRKGFEVDAEFLAIWDNIKHQTTYRVDYQTDELVTFAAKALRDLPEITAPSIRSTKTAITMDADGVGTRYVGQNQSVYDAHVWSIPDVLGYIQERTELTRSTLFQIVSQSNRMADILVNPQLFLDLATQAIRRVLNDLMIDGIKYRQIGNAAYEMTAFNAQELEVYLDQYTFNVSDKAKTIYDEFIPLDSNVEYRFAQDCESSEQIKFYFKLPNWFKIPTPIGNYNPDWALVFEGDAKIYFVAETKDTGTPNVDLSLLKTSEQLKIKCGKAHFDEFDNVEYKVVSKVNDLV